MLEIPSRIDAFASTDFRPCRRLPSVAPPFQRFYGPPLHPQCFDSSKLYLPAALLPASSAAITGGPSFNCVQRLIEVCVCLPAPVSGCLFSVGGHRRLSPRPAQVGLSSESFPRPVIFGLLVRKKKENKIERFFLLPHISDLLQELMRRERVYGVAMML